MTAVTPAGATLTAPIGPTDRGVLWRATKHTPGDRIVRLVDPRFCDERFRDTLRRLRERPHPHALPIVGEGWSDADYAVEYALDAPMWTLGELLARCPRWTDRLRLLGRVCDAIAQWQRDPQLNIGIGRHNLVFPAGAGGPRLLPCPPVALSAPDDLFGLDPATLAAVSPEIVRGVPLHQPAQDRYALGTLAAQAIGWAPSPLVHDDAERVEAQARGALLAAADTVEPFLRGTPQLTRLTAAIGHYRHPLPEARPPGVGELRGAIEDATDLLGLARTLRPADPDSALRVLSWLTDPDGPATASAPATISAPAAASGPEDTATTSGPDGTDEPAGGADPPAGGGAGRRQGVAGLRLGAEICAERGDAAGALARLDHAVRLMPDLVDLRRERAARLAGCPDERLPDLIADLCFVEQRDPRPSFQRRLAVAEAWRRLGDRHEEAAALYEALRLDGTAFEALCRYGECLGEIGTPEQVADLVRLARPRIDTAAQVGRFDEQGRKLWHQRFTALLDAAPPGS